MFKKEYKINFEWDEIIYKNSWDFKKTIDELFINWKLIKERSRLQKELTIKESVLPTFEINYNKYDIKILWWINWYLSWKGFSIFINDKFVWWVKLANIYVYIIFCIFLVFCFLPYLIFCI
jgi:hypothetical protein